MTGCSLCTHEIAPSVFGIYKGIPYVLKEGSEYNLDSTHNSVRVGDLAIGANSYIKPDGTINTEPRVDTMTGTENMWAGTREVSQEELPKVIEAAEECPGEYILNVKYTNETSN